MWSWGCYTDGALWLHLPIHNLAYIINNSVHCKNFGSIWWEACKMSKALTVKHGWTKVRKGERSEYYLTHVKFRLDLYLNLDYVHTASLSSQLWFTTPIRFFCSHCSIIFSLAIVINWILAQKKNNTSQTAPNAHVDLQWHKFCINSGIRTLQTELALRNIQTQKPTRSRITHESGSNQDWKDRIPCGLYC